MIRFSLPALLFACAAPVVLAGEEAVELADGPGRALVEARCVSCHSLDYIQMNSPFLDRKGWEASVAKMIRVMGAEVPEADAREIVDYLASRYGRP
jgi:mono/diheme cytochrome c family protein